MTNKEILDNIEADINTDSIIEYTEREVLIAMEHARYDEAINFANWLNSTNWGEKETWGRHDPPSIPSIKQLYDIYCETLNSENISCNKSCSPSDWHKGGKCDLNGCYHE